MSAAQCVHALPDPLSGEDLDYPFYRRSRRFRGALANAQIRAAKSDTATNADLAAQLLNASREHKKIAFTFEGDDRDTFMEVADLYALQGAIHLYGSRSADTRQPSDGNVLNFPRRPHNDAYAAPAIKPDTLAA